MHLVQEGIARGNCGLFDLLHRISGFHIYEGTAEQRPIEDMPDRIDKISYDTEPKESKPSQKWGYYMGGGADEVRGN